MSRTIRVAVVGAGPSGFYAAQALTRQLDTVRVDLFERLPAPYGLVRYGVAPDHPKLKSVTKVFDQIAVASNVRFVGNVELGQDVSLAQLQQHYHAVIVATGTALGNKPGIPGESLAGSTTAAEFVGWFNGHPDHQHHQFDLSAPHVAVIGNGNVALDVARILLRPVQQLRTTDITAQALDCLSKSKVTDVHIIGRRGPAQASFGKKELREFEHLSDVQCRADSGDFALTAEMQNSLDNDSEQRGVYDALAKFSESWTDNATTAGNNGKRCHFHFYKSATELQGSDRLEQISLKSNLSERPPPSPIDCRLVVFSIGYHGEAVDTLAIDSRTGAIDNDQGRVLVSGKPLPGVYVSGWIKRGPTGLIGTNRADSVATVEALIEDIEQLPEPQSDADLLELFAARGHQTIDFAGWLAIHQAEQQRGAARQAPAEKLTSINEMLAAAGRQST